MSVAMICLGIVLAIAGAFAAGQGTVVTKNQKWWLVAAWLILIPTAAALILSGLYFGA